MADIEELTDEVAAATIVSLEDSARGGGVGAYDVPTSDLLSPKGFEEPTYPGLTPVGEVRTTPTKRVATASRCAPLMPHLVGGAWHLPGDPPAMTTTSVTRTTTAMDIGLVRASTRRCCRVAGRDARLIYTPLASPAISPRGGTIATATTLTTTEPPDGG